MKKNANENIDQINEDKTKKRNIKAILKKAGKVFVIVVAAAMVAVGSAFAFAGCTPKNNQTQITPVEPVTPALTIQEVMDSNQANFNKFVNTISDEIKDIYDPEDKNIIYMACDVDDKDKTSIDDLSFYTAVKGTGDQRTIMYQTCTFNSISAQNIADDDFTLTDLTIESTDVARYDAYEKQNDEAYLNAHYEDSHDFVLKAYEKESIPDPKLEAQIIDVNTLITNYPTQSKNLGDKIAKAIINKYSIENPIYCGYSFFDENDKAEVAGMTVSVATKIDDTERKFANYRVVFDPVKLDDIASGTYTLSHTKVAMGSQQTYDAKEKQNDQDFLDSLYAQDDFAYVAYENESFPSITMQELLSDYGDTVNANLATHYDNALQRVFAGRYSTRKDQVTNYQWDLGEVNENNEIQHAKLTFLWENNDSAILYVCDVDFNAPISIDNLKNNSNISSISATYTPSYSFVYDNTIQGTRAELINAILDKAITDGFDCQNAEIMFKENSAGTTSDLGLVRSFSILIKSDTGIKQINATIQSSNTDEGLINKINQGKYTASCNTNINFINVLNEYQSNEAEMI